MKKRLNLQNVYYCTFDANAYDAERINEMTDTEVAVALSEDDCYCGYQNFNDFIEDFINCEDIDMNEVLVRIVPQEIVDRIMANS